MKYIKTTILWCILFISCITVLGCNTIRGAGEDIEQGGRAIKNAATK